MFAGHPLDGQVRQGIKGPEYAHPIRIGDDCWIGGSAIFLGMTLRIQPLNDQQGRSGWLPQLLHCSRLVTHLRIEFVLLLISVLWGPLTFPSPPTDDPLK